MKTIGYRYCGGCRESYDRHGTLSNIKKLCEDRTDISLEFATETKNYDKLLLLCGCTNRCVNITSYHAKEVVYVWDIKSADAIEEQLVSVND